jgi:putative ABC transport system substrate-binding protein
VRNARKRLYGLLTTLLLATVSPAAAQQAKNLFRIGHLSPYAGPETRSRAFQQGLHDLGYVEGENIVIERRFANANTELANKFAKELVDLRVDVVFTNTTPLIQAVKKLTTTIPIVMIAAADPVEGGLIASLARPGGNITGLTSISADLYGKRLELLKEIVPRLMRVGVLRVPDFTSRSPRSYKEVEATADSLGLKLQSLEVNRPGDIEKAFQTASRTASQALIHFNHTAVVTHRKRVAELATQARLPMIFNDSQFMDAGGLMSYGAYSPDLFRRAATYVDKIAKGARPGDLPIERPIKFEFFVNLKTAKQIGLTIPPNVLGRADRVIQ